MSDFDAASLRQAFSGPHQDTRLWISYGTVDADAAGGRSVIFDDEQGNPLPYPQVMVTLQPNGVTVPCRVGHDVVGDGEGEWHPFVAGDEVLVAVPHGDEHGGCAIIKRFNQSFDAWPRQVAGQDSTQNTFAFRRLRTPYILESASSLLFRQATSGTFLSFDQTGQITLSNGDKHMLHLGHDFVGLQLGDNSVLVQLNPSTGQLLLQAAATQFVVDPSDSHFLTTGTLKLGTSGISPGQHAVTLEQVVNLFVNFVYFLATNGNPSTWSGSLLNPIDTSLTALDAAIQTWLVGAALPTPPVNAGAVGGGNLTTLVLTQSAILAALALPDLHGPDAVAGIPLPEPFIPGIGRSGLLV